MDAAERRLPEVFTRRQALLLLSRHQVEWALASGRWVTLRRGIYCRRTTLDQASGPARHLLHAQAALASHDDRHVLEPPLGRTDVRPARARSSGRCATNGDHRRRPCFDRSAGRPDRPGRRTSAPATRGAGGTGSAPHPAGRWPTACATCRRPTPSRSATRRSALGSRARNASRRSSRWQAGWPYAERGRAAWPPARRAPRDLAGVVLVRRAAPGGDPACRHRRSRCSTRTATSSDGSTGSGPSTRPWRRRMAATSTPWPRGPTSSRREPTSWRRPGTRRAGAS